ncbi:hypothetical protein V6N13_040692 [Hibiscus sabdariffa]
MSSAPPPLFPHRSEGFEGGKWDKGGLPWANSSAVMSKDHIDLETIPCIIYVPGLDISMQIALDNGLRVSLRTMIMHCSGKPSGKEDEIIDCKEPQDIQGITTKRRQPAMKEQ